jgi:hypothetical protein
MSTDTPFIQPAFRHADSPESLAAEERARYWEAIRALDLDPQEEEQFLAFGELDTFRDRLARRLSRTKLWDYAPDQRDAVKEARNYLQDFIGVEISYR